jgi:beta-lactamase superfamily II metal-dependent hydrolase
MSGAQVVVRMYNTGFGDCFLLTIPTSAGARRMLIDCGTHPASTGPRQAKRDAVPLLMQDLQAEAGQLRVEVVVASHRHRDHVSGFEAPEFDDLEVGEVWMPWTENPDDVDATNLRNRMGVAALTIEATRAAIAKPPPSMIAVRQLLDNDIPIIDNGMALKNEKSMATLWTGFAGSPTRKYLSVPTDPIETPLLPGVRIHLLGPGKDEKTIRDLEPPKSETFAHVGGPAVHAVDPTETDDAPLRQPFDDDWATSAADANTNGAFKGLRVTPEIKSAIKALAADELLAAAASLTSSINGTSLMFVLEFGGIFLFFPGDAQWGTWKAVLDSKESKALLRRCSFYKIGHHGSHNASPKTFVDEVMAPGSLAAVPVAPVTVWPMIPQTELVDAIRLRTVTIVQSDQPPTTVVPNVTVRGDQSIDFAFDVPTPPA